MDEEPVRATDRRGVMLVSLSAWPGAERSPGRVEAGAWNEGPLRGTTGDQARQIVHLLRIAINEAERQLQPLAVGLGFERGDGMQVAIETGDQIGRESCRERVCQYV